MKFAGKTLITSISTALLLTACGGGGGGGSGDSTPPTTAASTVTSTNMQDVSAQGVAAVNGINSQFGAGAGMVLGVSVDTASVGLVDATLHQLYRALRHQSGSSVVTGIEIAETMACEISGSVRVTGTIASYDYLSAGDTLSITATNCVDADGTANGKVDVKFNSVSGDPSVSSAWKAEMATTFSDFSVASGGETATVTGDMLIKVDQANFSSTSHVVSGSSLKIGVTKGGSTVHRTITNYTFAGSEISGVQTYNATFAFAGTTPRLGDFSYTVTTLADLKQYGDNYPYQGAMKIKASDNTSVTVTAVNSTDVSLGLDKNGDGTVDETTTTTWAALTAQS